MGSVGKIFTKVATSAGLIKKVPKVVQPLVKAGAALEAGRDPTDKAKTATALASERRVTRAERTEAAKRRARRAGRRGLMMAGRLGGGGGEQEETKTTLGA